MRVVSLIRCYLHMKIKNWATINQSSDTASQDLWQRWRRHWEQAVHKTVKVSIALIRLICVATLIKNKSKSFGEFRWTPTLCGHLATTRLQNSLFFHLFFSQDIDTRHTWEYVMHKSGGVNHHYFSHLFQIFHPSNLDLDYWGEVTGTCKSLLQHLLRTLGLQHWPAA